MWLLPRVAGPGGSGAAWRERGLVAINTDGRAPGLSRDGAELGQQLHFGAYLGAALLGGGVAGEPFVDGA